jgi:hypothetical protein
MLKPEIQERLGLGANEGEDQILVTVRTRGDGTSVTSAAKSYAKQQGIALEDIISVEHAGRPDNGFGQVMLVTYRVNDNA